LWNGCRIGTWFQDALCTLSPIRIVRGQRRQLDQSTLQPPLPHVCRPVQSNWPAECDYEDLQVNPGLGASQAAVWYCGCTYLSSTSATCRPCSSGVCPLRIGRPDQEFCLRRRVSSAIIVGSHNPAQLVLLRRIPRRALRRRGRGCEYQYWRDMGLYSFSLHGRDVQDLCVQLGVPPGPSATVQIVDPQFGTYTRTCNTAGPRPRL